MDKNEIMLEGAWCAVAVDVYLLFLIVKIGQYPARNLFPRLNRKFSEITLLPE